MWRSEEHEHAQLQHSAAIMDGKRPLKWRYNWVGPQQLNDRKLGTENPKTTTIGERAITARTSCRVKQQPWSYTRVSAERMTGHPVPGTKPTSQSASQTNK
ncbi:hypothetical protein ACFX15_020171 [Malus domestica]